MPRRSSARALSLAFAALGIASSLAGAAPLSPSNFASLGTLAPSAGTYTANTNGTTPTLTIGGTVFTGVIAPQGSGLPDVAVFTFDNVSLGNGVTITMSGARPIAILSKGNIAVNGSATLNASANGQAGGPGGGKGGDGGGYDPNTNTTDNPSSNGAGPGGGVTNFFLPGGGGGFGGAGGVGGPDKYGDPDRSAGGNSYGDLSVGLQGGSGGGGFATTFSLNGAGGGGGVALIATGDVSIADTALLAANGDAGTGNVDGGIWRASGGGSGGGVYVAGEHVQFTSSRGINAKGGNGGIGSNGEEPTAYAAAGGGGGGRVLVRANTYTVGTDTLNAVTDVRGGTAGVGADAGGNGTAIVAVGTTIVPSGRVFATPTFANATFSSTNYTLQSNAIAAIRGDLPNAGTVSIGSGATFAVGGVASGNAWTLDNGSLVASGGLKMTAGTMVSGRGTIIAAISGGSPGMTFLNNLGGGTLMIGDASRTDGVDYDGSLLLGTQSPANLILLDADHARIGSVTMGAGSVLSAPNGTTLRAGRGLFAQGSARIDGDFTNDGVVNGPTAAGQTLTFTGDVNGAGSFGGNVLFGDGFAPGTVGSAAAVSLGSYASDASTTLAIDLGGPTAGTETDRLNVSSSAAIHGTLALSSLLGYTPAYGVAHRILAAASMSGQFAKITGNQLAADRWLAVTYASDGVDVTAAVPGDADLNRAVDFADLLALAKHYGQSSQIWLTGDFDGTGSVDFNDLLALARHYNQTASPAVEAPSNVAADWALAVSLVPEPTTLALVIGTGGLGLSRQRRAQPA